MGTELLIVSILAVSFGIIASLLATRVDNLQRDLNEMRLWRNFWEHRAEDNQEYATRLNEENAKLVDSLMEALSYLGEDVRD